MDKQELKSLFIVGAVIYLVLFLPTCFIWHFDKYTAWIISLISKDLRLLLFPIAYYRIFGVDKFFWLTFFFVALNIPTDFADILTIDLLDRILYLPKLVLAIFIGVEIYNEKHTK